MTIMVKVIGQMTRLTWFQQQLFSSQILSGSEPVNRFYLNLLFTKLLRDNTLDHQKFSLEYLPRLITIRGSLGSCSM